MFCRITRRSSRAGGIAGDERPLGSPRHEASGCADSFRESRGRPAHRHDRRSASAPRRRAVVEARSPTQILPRDGIAVRPGSLGTCLRSEEGALSACSVMSLRRRHCSHSTRLCSLAAGCPAARSCYACPARGCGVLCVKSGPPSVQESHNGDEPFLRAGAAGDRLPVGAGPSVSSLTANQPEANRRRSDHARSTGASLRIRGASPCLRTGAGAPALLGRREHVRRAR